MKKVIFILIATLIVIPTGIFLSTLAYGYFILPKVNQGLFCIQSLSRSCFLSSPICMNFPNPCTTPPLWYPNSESSTNETPAGTNMLRINHDRGQANNYQLLVSGYSEYSVFVTIPHDWKPSEIRNPYGTSEYIDWNTKFSSQTESNKHFLYIGTISPFPVSEGLCGGEQCQNEPSQEITKSNLDSSIKLKIVKRTNDYRFEAPLVTSSRLQVWGQYTTPAELEELKTIISSVTYE